MRSFPLFSAVAFALILIALIAGRAHADTIGFDDITTSPTYETFQDRDLYRGFHWHPFSSFPYLYALNVNWYHTRGNTYSFPSGEYALWTANGFTVTKDGGGTFDFNGAFVSTYARYDSYWPYISARTLTVSGYREGRLVGSVTVSLSTDRFDWLSANLFGIDKLVFSARGSGAYYNYFLLDNFITNQTTVPEPFTVALFGSGLGFLLPVMRSRKKKRAAA